MDDDMIREDIDLADCDDRFAYVKRIALPVFYAWQNKLIQELARVEHVRTPQSAAFSARLDKLGNLAMLLAMRLASSRVSALAISHRADQRGRTHRRELCPFESMILKPPSRPGTLLLPRLCKLTN